MAMLPRGPRSYKDFLTPSLHRRFTGAATTLLVFSYVESILVGEPSFSFWSWFPFGKAGIRALLLFISPLAIFILRVAQLQVGTRTTSSPFQTFRQYLIRYSTIQTLGWYSFSAWWFSEVLIWSAEKDANLSWILNGKSYERPRLNERPIYFTSFLLILAVVQSIFHLYYDYDRVFLSATKIKLGSASTQRAHVVIPPVEQLRAALPSLIITALKRSFVMSIITPFIYVLWVRQTAWKYSVVFAKVFWSLSRSSSVPGTRPFHMSVLIRCFYSGFLLTFTWEVANATFGAYVSQEPLKLGRPLTDDSRDPNGSLLTGLKAKKEVPKAFAFWELLYIAQQFPLRRKSIFEEIDRKGGATWSQILDVCLAVINGINSRITDHENASKPVQPHDSRATLNPEPLPRIASSLKEDNIFAQPLPPSSRREAVQTVIGSFAKSHGQGGHSQTSPRARKLISDVKNVVLSKDQQEAVSPKRIRGLMGNYVLHFLRSPLGQPFRQTFARRVRAVVLGSLHGDLAIIIDSIDSLTKLAVCSLTEDPFGKVQGDVPAIIRTFTSTITKLKAFKETLAIHWTDVSTPPSKERESEDTDVLVIALQGALGELLKAFGEYAGNLGLSIGEMRLAREAAASAEIEPVKATE